MGFEQCHPAVNFIYFVAVLYGMLAFQHPIFLAISFICAFVYSVKRNGYKSLFLNILLCPLIIIFALYYSSYTHFGITVLSKNMIGNNFTLESILYGCVIGCIVSGVIMLLSCIYSIFTTDKVVYLFGRLSPKFSMYFAALLRLVPRIKEEARKINSAQCGIGRGVNQGNILARIKNCVRIFSIIITWLIDKLMVTSEAMRCRGSSIKGRKAFSIYRFDNRDRVYVIFMVLCITITMAGAMLGQTDIVYNPRIIIYPSTYMSWVFYVGYMFLCIMPFLLEVWTEHRFNKSRENLGIEEKMYEK